MAVPADQDLEITRGDTEVVVVTITSDGSTPVNITGRVYTAQIRSTPDSSTVKASFTCTITNAAGGVVACTLSASSSALLNAGKYFWDLQENASGVISTLLSGTVTVYADVTR